MVRGYSGKALLFQEKVEVERAEDLEPLAKATIKRLLPFPKHMIEIEFLDEPDFTQRFFRIGTDPGRMVDPVAVDLEKFPSRRAD